MTRVAIDLPDELAAKARAEGLLRPRVVRAMIEERLRRQAGRRLLKMAGRLAAANPRKGFTSEQVRKDVQAEIAAVRAAKGRKS
jgi:hypothetical protein